ncbi:MULTISPECIES: hypothetical protein [Streptomyces]|uniref:Uncharacterized protein n=1 Tax=Streptomyces fimbriatus TaxID=68197 RepID=A0ABW0D4D5_STRFI
MGAAADGRRDVRVDGCGAVGRTAAGAAVLEAAERVIALDRVPGRLAATERCVGAEAVDCTGTDVAAGLRERTDGRVRAVIRPDSRGAA